MLSGRSSSNANGPHYTLVGGPEVLVNLAGAPSSEKATKTTNESNKRWLVVFNPRAEDDHLVAASWKGVLGYYVDRAFPGEENKAMRDKIRAHYASLAAKPSPGSRRDLMEQGDKSNVAITADRYLKGSGDLAETEGFLRTTFGLLKEDLDVAQQTNPDGFVPFYMVQDAPVGSLDEVAVVPL
eukprot:CAMPEP_0167829850 /NCGR_PEP_ID=MMETSP0112_2-20121227/12488_1 /TAXON_ID=91324 /ORGANISM="Lotharella globosa, Strain CCCM811" /LENGTH=182 /DNA_ID=CAMNT_0007733789 /DNA_START=88 /DNA_END=636 /DNA_ORIENTATION=+